MLALTGCLQIGQVCGVQLTMQVLIDASGQSCVQLQHGMECLGAYESNRDIWTEVLCEESVQLFEGCPARTFGLFVMQHHLHCMVVACTMGRMCDIALAHACRARPFNHQHNILPGCKRGVSHGRTILCNHRSYLHFHAKP